MNPQSPAATPDSPRADRRHGYPMTFAPDPMAHLLVGLCRHRSARHAADYVIVATRQSGKIDFK
jgi:hypothetical protein